jgi:hypothetical protein
MEDQPGSREECRMTCKPYDIPKTLIWEAWLHVKANQGAAGIDAETIERFEKMLGDNLYKLWNRMSSGSYFPPPGEGCADSEEVRRRPDIGHPDSSRQGRADGGEDVAGATA